MKILHAPCVAAGAQQHQRQSERLLQNVEAPSALGPQDQGRQQRRQELRALQKSEKNHGSPPLRREGAPNPQDQHHDADVTQEIMGELIPQEAYENMLNWHYDLEKSETELLIRPTCAPQYYRLVLQRAKAEGKVFRRRSLKFSTGGSKGCLAG